MFPPCPVPVLLLFLLPQDHQKDGQRAVSFTSFSIILNRSHSFSLPGWSPPTPMTSAIYASIMKLRSKLWILSMCFSDSISRMSHQIAQNEISLRPFPPNSCLLWFALALWRVLLCQSAFYYFFSTSDPSLLWAYCSACCSFWLECLPSFFWIHANLSKLGGCKTSFIKLFHKGGNDHLLCFMSALLHTLCCL